MSYADFKRNTILSRSYDLASNMSMSEARKSLITQHKEAEAFYRTQFQVCKEAMGDQLKYMGTSTVVRDMDFITKRLEGDDALMSVLVFVSSDNCSPTLKLLSNFYGLSYGTILGQYLVNM